MQECIQKSFKGQVQEERGEKREEGLRKAV
jgi:hypothetical protein